MAERKDYYAILGVAQQAEARDIKQAYRRRAQLYHPDKAAAAGIAKEEAERQFHDLAEAYEVQPPAAAAIPRGSCACLDCMKMITLLCTVFAAVAGRVQSPFAFLPPICRMKTKLVPGCHIATPAQTA